MRLDLDCIRDILLTVEENTGYNKFMVINKMSNEYELLNKYDGDKVMYHIIQSKEHGLIESGSRDLGGNIPIGDLTPEGHKFLANIRENNNWNKTKKIANSVGSTSLDAIKQIAVNVISGVIASKFQ